MNVLVNGNLGPAVIQLRQRKICPPMLEKIAKLKEEGTKLILVLGIGRTCHITFWEPHFAAEFDSVDDWKKQPHRIGAKLHALTIEQNAITSFKSRSILVSCTANTIGPGLFRQAITSSAARTEHWGAAWDGRA